ncbi:MAG: AMP-binding protein [Desulfurococcales archaeon]|nr:AMP-binding protein [Desulfurococcales archaeon]
MEDKLWYPPKELVDNANVTQLMEKLGISTYKDLVKESLHRYEWFWGELPQWLGIEWFKEPRQVLDASKGPEWTRWYLGSKLNLTWLAVDRHVKEGRGWKTAFIWEGEDGSREEYTYQRLRDEVDRLAYRLLEEGIGRGDVVLLYSTMHPSTIVAFYATLKIGASVAPVFSGFAASAVAERIASAKPKAIITLDGYLRKGRRIRLKDKLDEALLLSGHSPQLTIIARRLNLDLELGENEEFLEEAVSGKRSGLEPVEVDSEDIALIMYTSGTTGKPKGIQIRQHGAALMPAKDILYNMDLKEGDNLLWVSDIGWMMGPWQILGVNILGETHTIIEGAVDYPGPERLWRIIEKDRITQFGFAATLARLLKRYGKTFEKFNLESLRAFGNTGEPIDRDTWFWVMYELGDGKRPLINLSGGTDMFGPIVLPSPVVPLKPSTLWGPGLGCDVDVFDDEGNPVRGNVGYLVVKKPLPSMTWGFFGEGPERYLEAYWSRFPGVWYHGDWALIDEDGYWFILGRADDVIKVAGKRIGSAEIEDALNTHPAVAESACIGVPDPLKGEVIACFAVPKVGVKPEELDPEELAGHVAAKLGKAFKPKYVVPVQDLPRTRSGKIMRRVIRALVRGTRLGELSVLENPSSINEVKKALALIGLGEGEG